MKKILNLFIFVTIFSVAANAQSDYKSGIGLRFGGYYDLVSASYKTFISEQGAIELNLGFRNYAFGGFSSYNWFVLSASGAYQHHFDIKPVPGLKWFVGGGLTAYNSFSDFDATSGFGLAIFPTAGVDYKFASIPLNVSVDTRPTVNIIRADYYSGFYFSGGVAARYTF